jgi:hypothetical protein
MTDFKNTLKYVQLHGGIERGQDILAQQCTMNVQSGKGLTVLWVTGYDVRISSAVDIVSCFPRDKLVRT